jgi:serine/threonine-protein kinase
MASSWSSGQRVGGYVIHGELAVGGMAVVHLGAAAGEAAPRWVAVKRLHPHLAADPEIAAMFLEEGRLAARVRHPNVVATIEVLAQGQEVLLVMELCRGAALAAATPPVPPPLAARILIDTLRGLDAAHEARGDRGEPLEIVHRDVTPHNLLVGVDGVTRVADFGIALAEGRIPATAPGRTKGTLAYMSPEQLRGQRATRRSDLYGASVVLWEALTGRRLFPGASSSEVFGKVLEGVVRPPSAHAPVSPALDALVLRGLSRDPGHRFATAHEMADTLEHVLPPAPPGDVARWLAVAAGEAIAAQARDIEDLSTARPPEAKPHRSVFAAVAQRGKGAPPPRVVSPSAPAGAGDEPVTVTLSSPGRPSEAPPGPGGGTVRRHRPRR